jgi:hypothetical protein
VQDTENHRADVATPVWGADTLTQFIESARVHAQETIADDGEHFAALLDIDGIYRLLIPSVGNSERLPAVMLVRTHGSFLAAAGLALSGQPAEAYILLHTLLRTSLHAVFVAGNAGRQQLWMNRNNDDGARKQAQTVFKSENIRRHFRQIDAKTAGVCEMLMRRTLDHSSHPNVYADVFSPRSGGGAEQDFTEKYFVRGDEVQRYCLRSVAQAGICCLSMFFYVFPDLYRDSDIPRRLTQLRQRH